jgi:hypothetical protein
VADTGKTDELLAARPDAMYRLEATNPNLTAVFYVENTSPTKAAARLPRPT